MIYGLELFQQMLIILRYISAINKFNHNANPIKIEWNGKIVVMLIYEVSTLFKINPGNQIIGLV